MRTLRPRGLQAVRRRCPPVRGALRAVRERLRPSQRGGSDRAHPQGSGCPRLPAAPDAVCAGVQPRLRRGAHPHRSSGGRRRFPRHLRRARGERPVLARHRAGSGRGARQRLPLPSGRDHRLLPRRLGGVPARSGREAADGGLLGGPFRNAQGLRHRRHPSVDRPSDEDRRAGPEERKRRSRRALRRRPRRLRHAEGARPLRPPGVLAPSRRADHGREAAGGAGGAAAQPQAPRRRPRPAKSGRPREAGAGDAPADDRDALQAVPLEERDLRVQPAGRGRRQERVRSDPGGVDLVGRLPPDGRVARRPEENPLGQRHLPEAEGAGHSAGRRRRRRYPHRESQAGLHTCAGRTDRRQGGRRVAPRRVRGREGAGRAAGVGIPEGRPAFPWPDGRDRRAYRGRAPVGEKRRAATADPVGGILLRDDFPRSPAGSGARIEPQREARTPRGSRASAFARSAGPPGERSRAVPAGTRRVPAGAEAARRGARGGGGGPALPVPRGLSLPADAARVCLAPTARLIERLMAEPSARLELVDNDGARALAGGRSENLRLIEKRLGVHIGQRGNVFLISGEPDRVQLAERLLAQLNALIEKKYPLGLEDVEQACKVLLSDPGADLRDIFLDTVYVTSRNRPVTPKGFAQKAYIDAIRRYDIVFGIGPAGTGKTYLAMAMAVAALVERRVKRIVLCRPAVEAGEKLGFLPGDLAEKVSPYLRPLYDALDDLMDMDRAHDLIERGTAEVAPLAFMRGRTLNDSFVILDEAQNTTTEQMKMFLTRLGFGSKAVVTGDATQIDLPSGKASGMMDASQILKDIEGIRFCEFTDRDVVRHPLVQEVVRAYELAASKKP